MTTLNNTPFLRILVPFILGIILGDYLMIPITWLCIGCGIVGIILSYFFKCKVVFGSLIGITLFGLGYISIQDTYRKVILDPALNYPNTKINVTGIVQDVETKVSGHFITMANIALKDSASAPWISNEAKGKVFVAFDNDSTSIAKGDSLTIYGKLAKAERSDNPYVFDYAKYLLRNGITYQCYISQDNWTLKKKVEWKQVGCYLIQSRQYCQEILNKSIVGENERSIASALILGDKSSISQEIMTAYADTGAIHVLAVSGLHVMIVAAFINFLFLAVAKRNMTMDKVRILCTIVGVWLFALLTGSSPSVIRASTMFTIVGVGMLFRRDHNVINCISFSAIIMLIYNPAVLFNIGFQFSYLAVFGIVLIHGKILPTLYPQNIVLRYLLSSLRVSLAAQLFVLPLSVYYFHKMSLLFWVTSPIVIVFATVILPLGILLLLTYGIWDGFTWALSQLLEKLISGFYWCVRQIHSIPLCSVDDLYINEISLLLLCLIVVGITIKLIKPEVKMATMLLSSAILLMINTSWHKIENLKQRKIIVYEIKGGDLLDIMIGENVYTYSTNHLTKKKENHLTYTYRLRAGIKNQIDLTSEEYFQDQNVKKEEGHLYVMNKLIILPNTNSYRKQGFRIYDYEIDSKANYIVSENTFIGHQFTQIDCVSDSKQSYEKNYY